MITLVMTNPPLGEIEAVASRDIETGGVLLAEVVRAPNGDMRLLGREIIWTPEAAYVARSVDEMTITSAGYVDALAKADQKGLVPLWLHTHPGAIASARPSQLDEIVDRELAEAFRIRTNQDFYGSVIFSLRSGVLSFTGRMIDASNGEACIERLWIVGDRWRLIHGEGSEEAFDETLFDRNIRAFGSGVQRTLRALKIGVVGVGGTGSSICEQLVRLGARDFILFDPDSLSASNTTRVYGSFLSDVGAPKVDIMSRHLRRIASDVRCETVAQSIVLEDVARKLSQCDIVFGCTDDNSGRLVLSRLPTFLLTPVIDLGVLVSADEHQNVSSIYGRVTVVAPGEACLVCRGRIDTARAAAEIMSIDERERLEAEGYAPALGNIEPAVVPFTTGVAALAVAELLERLIGYGPTPRPSEILLRFHERELSTNIASPQPGHYCANPEKYWGRSGRQPFLGQLWPQA